MKLNSKSIILSIFVSLLLLSGSLRALSADNEKTPEKPRIVNIVNFIRLLEPRDLGITQDVLYLTVVNQVEMMKEYKLKGTFLLQYDALMNERYQSLLSALPDSAFEIGAWWELPQPLVEKAGIKWRGRYPWDWHANVGFSVGYTPAEREKLVDVYMADFKKIYGRYPKSVGSWFIDAHSLNYMYEKYGIVASCNCRDQIGTDGYTLWGGYWNQGYYPSLKNAYMPAQNAKNQIPVPVFRMLGSDPVRQYDSGLGTTHQGVVTIEPVYGNAGGDSLWVDWYFQEFVGGECMEYAYVQVGQENSFTWDRMAHGFELQLPLVAKLMNEQKVEVQKLSQTGEWFSKNYETTPATSVTVKEDLAGGNYKTVWFNSRFYRANLLWDKNTFRFRDIHLFDEEFESSYLKEVETTSKCAYSTLPFVDGFGWSTADEIAGLRLKAVVDGKELLLEGGDPVVDDSVSGKLHIEWPLTNVSGTLVIDMDEKQMAIKVDENETLTWFLELTTKENAELPFEQISDKQINCSFNGMSYSVVCKQGGFKERKNDSVLSVEPKKNQLRLDFSK